MRVELKVIDGPASGKTFIFDEPDVFMFGRGGDAHCSLPSDRTISRHHFLIQVNPPDCTLLDLGSSNGTTVNGVRYGGKAQGKEAAKRPRPVRLSDGDKITAGKTTFHVIIAYGLRCEQCGKKVAADAKPVVVTEPWYEFIKGIAPAADIRFAAWAAILSGAAGHSYAGGQVWQAHVPESPSRGSSWPMEKSFEVNTLLDPGAKSIGFLSRYLRDLAWWKLGPHPEYVLEYPAPYCAADPGKEYLIFLRYGGTVKVDLTHTRRSTFRYQVVNLRTREVGEEEEIEGGQVVTIGAAGNDPSTTEIRDYLLHIRK